MAAAAIVSAAILLGWRHPPSSVPVTGLGFVSYTNRSIIKSRDSVTQTWLVAKMVLTNGGRSSFMYWGLGANAWARAQTPTGWTNCLVIPNLSKGFMVNPGSNTTFTVWLPEDALRWQCGLSVRTPSIRQLVGSKVNEAGLYQRLYPFSGRLLHLLPSQMGHELKAESDMFEVKQHPESPPHNERSGVDAGRASLFAFLCPCPGATHRERWLEPYHRNSL